MSPNNKNDSAKLQTQNLNHPFPPPTLLPRHLGSIEMQFQFHSVRLNNFQVFLWKNIQTENFLFSGTFFNLLFAINY